MFCFCRPTPRLIENAIEEISCLHATPPTHPTAVRESSHALEKTKDTRRRKVSRRLLICSFDHPRELIKLYILSYNRTPNFVLFVQRHLDLIAVEFPAADIGHKIVQFGPTKAQPAFEHFSRDFLHTLAYDYSDAYPHDLLKALHIGDKVGVEVVPIQGVPKLSVLRVVQVVVQYA
jgi:hypothetical protein